MDLKAAGNEAFRRGDWEEASELYTRALVREPELVAAIANRAACSIALERWPAARRDTELALSMPDVPPQLHAKLIYRKAVAIRAGAQGSRREWEALLKELDVLSPQDAQHERSFLFVEVTRPDEFVPRAGKVNELVGNRLVRDPSIKIEPKPREQRHIPPSDPNEIMPSLPLTYQGVLQLTRHPTPEVYNFWYEHVDGQQLKQALAKAGVEPAVLDYVHEMAAARPENVEQSREFMRALSESPRYETARLMADEELREEAEKVTNK